MIAVYLIRDPAIADNCLAQMIGGISKNTVADVRRELEETCQIAKLTKLRGKDGKERPKKFKRIIANTPKQIESACEAIEQLPEANAGKLMDVVTAERRSRRAAFTKRIADMTLENAELPSGAIAIEHCRFQDLDIDAESAELVLADPPWVKEFMDQWKDLAAFAQHVLKPGGFLVSFVGTRALPEVLNALATGLTWRWLISEKLGENVSVIEADSMRISSRYHPIVVFSKGELSAKRIFSDLINGDGQEKDWHEWQQNLKTVEKLVQYFSAPGDLVIDPCLGGGTTAIACRNQGRRFVGCDCDESAVARSAKRLATESVARLPLAETASERSTRDRSNQLMLSSDVPVELTS